jgi:hypothetical protein
VLYKEVSEEKCYIKRCQNIGLGSGLEVEAVQYKRKKDMEIYAF